MDYPEDLLYTRQHEWLRRNTDGTVRLGITAYAQDALGDVVYVSLPAAGDPVQAGQPVGEVESTKSVSELYAPVSGTVLAANDALSATPELVNADPYGDGWMIELRPTDESGLDGLLDAADYRALVGAG